MTISKDSVFLNYPFNTHANSFMERIAKEKTHINFYDGGIVVKEGGKWQLRLKGGFDEASKFINQQEAKYAKQ